MSEPDLEGKIIFNITVNTFDMRDWSPEKITMFFQGLAEIVKAANADVSLFPLELRDQLMRESIP